MPLQLPFSEEVESAVQEESGLVEDSTGDDYTALVVYSPMGTSLSFSSISLNLQHAFAFSLRRADGFMNSPSLSDAYMRKANLLLSRSSRTS
jgi:hypothetical protein